MRHWISSLPRVAALLVLALLAASGAPEAPAAHEALGREGMEALLARIDRAREVIAAAPGTDELARAHFALGEGLRQAVETLNRGLATHGGESDLRDAVLRAELERRGVALEPQGAQGTYRLVREPYLRYLTLAPDGPDAATARFRLLQAAHEENFGPHPLDAPGLTWPAARAQVAAAEGFLARHPDYGERAEVLFILGVASVRAARLAPGAEEAASYRARARQSAALLAEEFPGDMRTVALRTLSEVLE